MIEPTTYALPDEPEGPLWDFCGERWDKSPAHGLWCGPDAKKRHWGDVLWFHGPLTATPPWKPEVGGTVETEEQYAAMPKGSIVAQDENEAWWRDAFGVWNSSFAETNRPAPPSDGATILRVGWSL